MTWSGLILKNLLRRKVRTFLTAIGVALGVALIVALLSISNGVKATASDLIHVGRSDFGLFQEGASDLTRSVIPASLEPKIKNVPGVARVAKVYIRVGGVEGNDSFLIFGLDRHEFPYQRLVVVSGHLAKGNEVMLGDAAASNLNKKAGELLHLAGHAPVRIAGIYHSGNRFVDLGGVLPLPFVQALAGRPGDLTTLAVEVNPGARPSDVSARIQKDFQGIVAITEPGQVVKVDTSSRLIINAGWIFSLIALIIGGMGVMNTMAMAVSERVHEIGILRAIGWKTSRIAVLIVSEAIGICLLGLVVGFALGYAAAEIFISQGSLSTLVTPIFTPGVFLWGCAFALFIGIVGALYPAWRAVKLRPIEALQRS
jgi:putative ABC transport system permease protein